MAVAMRKKLHCSGKDYASKNVLTCPMHALAYEIECNHRADDAAEIIDPDLGRGYSNACEATFSVFTKFRPKDVALQTPLSSVNKSGTDSVIHDLPF